eukprot:5238698-Amphidinium_carterae.1
MPSHWSKGGLMFSTVHEGLQRRHGNAAIAKKVGGWDCHRSGDPISCQASPNLEGRSNGKIDDTCGKMCK